MFASKVRDRRQIRLATELFETLAEKLDSRISVRLWDDSVIPLGCDPDPEIELSIAGPGVLGSLLRRPTSENLLNHYARGYIDYHGTDLRSFIETARVKGSRRRTRGLPLLLLARAAIVFVGARQLDVATSCRFSGEDTGLNRRPADNRDYIRFHYDLSNDFYRLFLDDQMVYTCAYFHNWDDSLEQAQHNKLDMVCRKLQLKPGDRFLDIGCGWGGLVCHAAEHYGVTAHGVTLSEAQITFARETIRRRGLEQRARVELLDYNDVAGSYDKIASIGMAEHVGIANLPGYMRKMRSLLRPQGLFLNHAITRPAKSNAKAFRKKSAERRLLTKYIFPGGELGHQGHVIDCMEANGLEVHDVEGWRDHYGLTCKHWSQRLEANRKEAIRLVGFEKYRIWQLYLAGVGIALSDGTARVFQTLASNRVSKGHSGMPPTRQHLFTARQDTQAA